MTDILPFLKSLISVSGLSGYESPVAGLIMEKCPSLAGISTVSVSGPHRYTRSPVSISRVDDWKPTINLLHAALKRITPELIAPR